MKYKIMILVTVYISITGKALEIYDITPANGTIQLDMTVRDNDKLIFYTRNASEPTSLEFIKINGKPMAPETASISWVDKTKREQRWEFSSGLFVGNKLYNVTIEMQDMDSEEIVVREIQFDTFNKDTIYIQAENYDYNGGEHSSNIQDYPDKKGILGTDYYSISNNANDYRKQDSIIINRDITNTKQSVYVNRKNGEWCNYTRSVPLGEYTLYARAKHNGAGGVLRASLKSSDLNDIHSNHVSTTDITEGYNMVKIGARDGGGIKIYKDVSITLNIKAEYSPQIEGSIDIDYIVLVPIDVIITPQLQAKENIDEQQWEAKNTGWDYNSAGEIILTQYTKGQEYYRVKIGDIIKNIKAYNRINDKGYIKIVVE